MRVIDPKRFKNVPFLYPTLDPLFQVSFKRAPGDPKDDPETNIHKYGCRFMCEMAMCQFISKKKLKKVDILDSSRYNSDTHFRSVADSAKRAVYVCGPYKIFANKYADKYDMWKTMLLRFNPFDASIN